MSLVKQPNDETFEGQLSAIQAIVNNLLENPTANINEHELNNRVALMCNTVKDLPVSDRKSAIVAIESLLRQIDNIITFIKTEQKSISKKLSHVRPHKNAVAAFLKASKVD